MIREALNHMKHTDQQSRGGTAMSFACSPLRVDTEAPQMRGESLNCCGEREGDSSRPFCVGFQCNQA